MFIYLERVLRESGDQGPAQIISGLHRILGRDIAFPTSGQILNLEQATRECKDNPTDPEALTQFMHAFWTESGQKIGKDIVVGKFPSTSKKIREEREKNGRMPIFVPAEVNNVDLGRMFPEIKTWAVREGNSIVDKTNNSGWLWIEASVNAPNGNTTQKKLENKFKKEKRQGQSLKTYIIGSQISKLLTDKYFDQELTWSRLLASCVGGGVLSAVFLPDGALGVHSSWSPEAHCGDVGGRSEEVIKT